MATERQCLKALTVHEESLSRRANVVGLGIISTVAAESSTEDLAVAVYVEKKVALEELAEEDRIPETLEVEEDQGPRQIPVRIIEQGPVELEEPSLE